jgi:hypothetical protein
LAWSGKLLGGLVGGMVGGPVGAGVGAAIGHYLADGEGAAQAGDLVVVRLEWRHHVFGPSGPCARLVPVWRARRHAGKDVEVRVRAGEARERAVVAIEEPDELCALPAFTLPYALLDPSDDADATSVRVTLSGPGGRDDATFDLPLPNRVKRMGLSGPARLVMALVACARAGERPLTRDDLRFVRETFCAAHPLDEHGIAWLRAWLRELREAAPERLGAEKVAARVQPHLPSGEATDLLMWLMRGARTTWPGGPQEAWIARFAEALGVDALRVSQLWEQLDGASDVDERARAAAVLGVSADAPPERIRAAWLQLVQQHHPDRARNADEQAEATRRTAELNAAWQVLRGG